MSPPNFPYIPAQCVLCVWESSTCPPPNVSSYTTIGAVYRRSQKGVVVVVHHGMMMMGKLHIWSDSLINFVLVPHGLVIVCAGKKKNEEETSATLKKKCIKPVFFL